MQIARPRLRLEAVPGLSYAALPARCAVPHVATGAFLGMLSFPVLIALAMTTGALLVTVVGAVVAGVALILATNVLASVHRSRFRALGLHIERPVTVHQPGPLSWFTTTLRSGAFWRSLLYGLAGGLVHLVAGTGLLVVFGWGLVAVTALMHGDAFFGAVEFGSALRTNLVATGAGLVALGLVLPTARLIALADCAVAVRLLGWSRAEQLHQQVAHLRESRTEVVDAADAERRRIERDLHDGAQQRLTALAMNLGIASATLTDLPEPAKRALDDAHTEAKTALVELRSIVRGLHPPVLDDRGLDAALSGLAGRCPVPVTLDVDLPRRPERTVEAVAYFVVSEALTNVVKHAAARGATVEVTQTGHQLRVRVVDDGVGGADPTRGTGLTGLRQRVASVDGRLTIESPIGGPTVLEVSLPCAS